jgi:hypothetical protein
MTAERVEQIGDLVVGAFFLSGRGNDDDGAPRVALYDVLYFSNCAESAKRPPNLVTIMFFLR